MWLPDADDPGAYDERIGAAGGVDLFLLASGASDGHVAFLPPGSPRDGRTCVSRSPRARGATTSSPSPSSARSRTCRRTASRSGSGRSRRRARLRLVLHGADKRAAAARLLALDGFDPSWPASIVHAHPDAEIWLDEEALAE